MSNTNFAVSISDLMLHPTLQVEERETSLILKDERRLRQILNDFGLDPQKPMDERVCKHRNLQGHIVDTIRFEGTERSDITWLQSGYASVEAGASKEMLKELESLQAKPVLKQR